MGENLIAIDGEKKRCSNRWREKEREREISTDNFHYLLGTAMERSIAHFHTPKKFHKNGYQSDG